MVKDSSSTKDDWKTEKIGLAVRHGTIYIIILMI